MGVHAVVKKPSPGVALAVLAVLALCGSCAWRSDVIEEPPTRTLMKNQVGSHYRSLLDELSREPQVQDDWQRIARDAAALTECGHRLADGQERPDHSSDETWQIATLTLREESAGIVAAAHAGDLTAARERFAQMNLSCSSCHRDCDAAYRLPW